MSVEEKFDKIAIDTSQRAGAVECSVDEYFEGLGVIIERLKEDIAAAKGF